MPLTLKSTGEISSSLFNVDSDGDLSTTGTVESISTSHLALPKGTTAQRPGSPVAGMIRHNTDTDEPEWYDDQNSTWRSFAEKSYNGYTIDYLIVAGGGAPGGSWSTGGGGGGGVVEQSMIVNSNTNYKVVIGAGATASNSGDPSWGISGSNSSLQDVIAVGGGGGGGWLYPGSRGGSGGGGSSDGTKVQGYQVYAQGFAGGTGQNDGQNYAGGGGGGAGGSGGSSSSSSNSGRGGPGHRSIITGTLNYYAAGGAGGTNNTFTSGGQGSTDPGVSGGANTGTGGGGNSTGASGGNKGNGGSGIVVIRYAGSQRGSGGTVSTTTVEGVSYTIHTFTSSGTFTA